MGESLGVIRECRFHVTPVRYIEIMGGFTGCPYCDARNAGRRIDRIITIGLERLLVLARLYVGHPEDADFLEAARIMLSTIAAEDPSCYA